MRLSTAMALTATLLIAAPESSFALDGSGSEVKSEQEVKKERDAQKAAGGDKPKDAKKGKSKQ